MTFLGPMGGGHAHSGEAEHPHPALFRDDDAGGFALSQEIVAGASCGTATPCVVTDTDTFLTSGLAPATWSAQFDLPEGEYSYHCVVHPTMRGTISIVGDEVPLPTREQIGAETAAQLAEDSEAIDDLVAERSVPRFQMIEGRKTWDVNVGVSTDHVAALLYAPGSLTIGAGDDVRFVAPDDPSPEPHSVTFPVQLVGRGAVDPTPAPDRLSGLGLIPACDVDAVDSGTPSLPYAFLACDPTQPSPLYVAYFTFELLWAPHMTSARPAPADVVATSATYHDSGLLAPETAPDAMAALGSSGSRLPSSFPASFPAPGSFSYACTLHTEFMSGSITVE